MEEENFTRSIDNLKLTETYQQIIRTKSMLKRKNSKPWNFQIYEITRHRKKLFEIKSCRDACVLLLTKTKY